MSSTECHAAAPRAWDTAAGATPPYADRATTAEPEAEAAMLDAPLPLRVLERKDSSSTSSSSLSPRDDDGPDLRTGDDASLDGLDDGSSESDDLDDDAGVYSVDGGDLAQEDFLVLKPMSMLPVCPMDDIAVDDEKRRRRNMRMMKKSMNTCADDESLPSPSSPLRAATRRAPPSQFSTGSDVTRPVHAPPLLRRDSMAIRQQYWKQLGLTMSRQDLERNTGRRRERRQGLKVELNDSRSRKGQSKSIFQMISSWYASSSSTRDDASSNEAPSSHSDTESTSTESSNSPRRRSVRFCEKAELFYIPLHKDYSKRQRDGMWHTRAEFIGMVERNLEQVYEEMEREYEEQVLAEAAENDAMGREESRQRAYEAQARAIEAGRVAKAALPSPPLQLRGLVSPGSSPPSLSLCPIATQIKVMPRARSPHDIRFKYLKHLGINT